jgi:shikimate kinase
MNVLTMKQNAPNIILIGMPGSGKSTVGVILAKLLSRGFVDTDLLIQTAQGRSLQGIVDTDGYLALRDIEAKMLVNLHCSNQVIATGGSAAYSHAAMTHLKEGGLVVFLHADLETLNKRVRDFSERGLAKSPGQTLNDLFRERLSLYTAYADITIDSCRLTHEEVCARIIEQIGEYATETN